MLQDRVEQGRGLQPVARRVARLLADAALVDRLLDARDDEPLAQPLDGPVAEGENLGEVVAGIDVHDREGELGRAERLLGEPQHHDRILAAREEQDGAFELSCDLAHDEDRLGLERVEVRQVGARHHVSLCFERDHGRSITTKTMGIGKLVNSP